MITVRVFQGRLRFLHHLVETSIWSCLIKCDKDSIPGAITRLPIISRHSYALAQDWNQIFNKAEEWAEDVIWHKTALEYTLRCSRCKMPNRFVRIARLYVELPW